MVSQNQRAQQHNRDYVHYLSTLVAGVGSGGLSSFTCAPLDLLRTRMQVWGEIQQQQQQQQKQQQQQQRRQKMIHNTINSDNTKMITTSTTATTTNKITPIEAFRTIIHKEGPLGIFRGLGATLVTVPLFWGVYFPLYDEMKHLLQTSDHTKHLTILQYHPGVVHCVSAIITGAVADLICNPLFMVRTRLQTQALHELTASSSTRNQHSSTKTSSLSMVQMAKQLKQDHGITIFWRGMTANLGKFCGC